MIFPGNIVSAMERWKNKVVWILMAASMTVSQGPPGDEILFLPGLAEQPNFKQYAGFLNVGATRKMFYWFVASQGSPDKDPLMLWLDGGPGCSAMVTLLEEHGPFRVADNGKTLVANPYSWNKLASVLYLEAPAGVGFSYDPSGNYTSNDDSTTDDIQGALLDFFSKFPSLKNNEFYIAGKGSAATYVVMLASRLVKDGQGINLKGYAIGNGALDFRITGNSLLFFGQYHGILDLELWNSLLSSCCNGSASEETCSFVEPPFISLECDTAVEVAAHNIIERGLNNYDLFDTCIGFRPERNGGRKHDAAQKGWSTSPYRRAQEFMLRCLNVKPWKNFGSNPTCLNYDNVTTYMNQPQVRKALHNDRSPLLWTPCSDSLLYATQYITVRDVIKKLVDSGRLKSLFYSGDTDMTFNVISNQLFVESLGLETLSEYKLWKLNEQVAGYYQTYKGNVTFLTVKGAGHMVAEKKPEEALAAISRLFKQAEF
ncbi:lysosomal protective protein-like [Amblyomma americanum]